MSDNFRQLRSGAAVLVLSAFALTGCATATGSMGELLADSAGIPQMAAFLPNDADVAPGRATPVDGVWKMNELGKRVRIDRGRVVVVDGWLHALVLKIQPGMVVTQNFRQTGARSFEGDDLPTMGKAVYSWDGGDTMQARIAGIAGPINLTLKRQSGVAGNPDDWRDDEDAPRSDDHENDDYLDDDEEGWIQ